MSLFIGEHDASVDAKGRVFIPAVFRKALPPEANETFVVASGLDGCLAAYGSDEWLGMTEKMRRLATNERKHRVFIRAVVSQASEAKIDRQGRITIPKHLLEKANIHDKVKVVGALDKIELWNPEIWLGFMKDADAVLEEVAEEIDLY